MISKGLSVGRTGKRGRLALGGLFLLFAVLPASGSAMAAGGPLVPMQLVNARLSDAEMAAQAGTGLAGPAIVHPLPSESGRVVLWDELRHPAQSSIENGSATIVVRVLP